MKIKDKIVLRWDGLGTALQFYGWKCWVKTDEGEMFWTEHKDIRPIEELNLSSGDFGPVKRTTK